MRTTLDVYSKAEVDSAIAAVPVVIVIDTRLPADITSGTKSARLQFVRPYADDNDINSIQNLNKQY